MRKLKYHEQKILKKVDFINWKNNAKEIGIMRRYHIDRHEYQSYHKLCLEIKTLAQKIIDLKDELVKVKSTEKLLEKLYCLGLIKTKRIKKCLSLDVKAFCRRRLPVFIIQSGMFNGPLSVAVKYIEHGHVKIGPSVVRDPAAFITLEQEDYISWDAKFKKKIDEYRGERDDYDE